MMEKDDGMQEGVAVTDDAPPDLVLVAVRACADAWVPEARIIGNVRAGDISRALTAQPAEIERLREVLDRIEEISDHVVNAERYEAEDAINDLNAIRSVIKRAALAAQEGK